LNLGDNFFSRFGLDPESEELRQVFRIIAKHDNLKIVGLHTHSTRPAKNPNIFYNKLVSLIEFAKDCKLIEHLDYIDIGGGFYGKMDENIRAQFDDIIPTYNDYGTLLGKTMKKYFPDEEVQLIIEPGVAVTVNILDYFVKIIDIKKIKTKYIALSSGTFYNIKPSGHKKNLSIEIYSRTKTTIQHNKNQYDIVGYTCLENDYLYSGYNGTLNVGDYCRFKNVGAYTIVFKPPFIKLAPPIFLLDNEKNETVREIENFEDTFKPYCFR
jgi:diaminopimelate decarboxylase